MNWEVPNKEEEIEIYCDGCRKEANYKELKEEIYYCENCFWEIYEERLIEWAGDNLEIETLGFKCFDDMEHEELVNITIKHKYGDE